MIFDEDSSQKYHNDLKDRQKKYTDLANHIRYVFNNIDFKSSYYEARRIFDILQIKHNDLEEIFEDDET